MRSEPQFSKENQKNPSVESEAHLRFGIEIAEVEVVKERERERKKDKKCRKRERWENGE